MLRHENITELGSRGERGERRAESEERRAGDAAS